MRTKHLIISILLVTISGMQIKAQNGNGVNHEVGFTTGVMVPTNKDFSGDVTFGLTYEKFYINGLGIRTGVQYTPYTAKLDHTFGVPLALAYRWSKKGNWAERASGSTLSSILLSLNKGTEFYAGITPGYVAAKKSGLHVSTDEHFKTERYTENGSPLFLSLDAGMSYSYPIGRVSLNLNPAIHYVLTDTYKVHSVTTDLIDGSTVAKDRNIRWLYSICGGISFAF